MAAPVRMRSTALAARVWRGTLVHSVRRTLMSVYPTRVAMRPRATIWSTPSSVPVRLVTRVCRVKRISTNARRRTVGVTHAPRAVTHPLEVARVETVLRDTLARVIRPVSYCPRRVVPPRAKTVGRVPRMA